MCRALLVCCLASDRESLQALKRATVGTEWELTPGALSADDAIAQIEDRGAHVLVVSGAVDGALERVRERWPWMRVVVVADEPVDGASAVVGSLDEVRGAVKGLPPTGGPVRS